MAGNFSGLRRRRTDGPVSPNIERVHLLMFDATGLGGVARSVITLANRLVECHEVHLHSLLRGSDELQFPIDPRVQVNWLIDSRRGAGHPGRPRHDRFARSKWRRMDSTPSELEPDPHISAYTDFVLQRELPKLEPGVLVTSRPMLHLAAARWAPDSSLRIAWDHLNFERRMRNRVISRILDNAVPTADAFVTLTDADRCDYQDRYPGMFIKRIPNPSPFALGAKAPLDAKVIVSGGRLVHRKGFDQLIDAWAPLAQEFPDWQVHIYGEGRCRDELEAQIADRGVADSVRLPGYTRDFEAVLASSGIYAMSSRIEGFPMVLLEAMSHGLPLISFDCPRGPAEIIEDGITGRLVKDGDVDAYTAALRDMILGEEQRRQMGATAYERARSYEVETVSQQWERLFTEVLERHRLAS